MGRFISIRLFCCFQMNLNQHQSKTFLPLINTNNLTQPPLLAAVGARAAVLLGKWYFQGGILWPDWINILHFLVLSGNTHGTVPSPLLKGFTTLRGLHKFQAARKILEEYLKKEKGKRERGGQKQTHKKASKGI